MNLPLPESDKDYLKSFDVFPDDRAAEHYLYCSWARTQAVLDWLAELQDRGMRRVLELGANPYYLTLLLTKYLSLHLELAKSQNIADDYSPHGVYGRHNREHTPSEVRALVERHGFVIERAEVPNIYPHPLRSRIIQALRPTVWREHIFVLAQLEK